jgi:hypothetical protein
VVIMRTELPFASLAPLGALLLAGCATDFTPASVVEDLRVLAIVAEPPDVLLPASFPGPTETVTLRATAVAPPATPGGLPADPSTVAWTFCPFSIGASTGYACAVPACEVPLTPGEDGSVTVDPVLLGASCLAATGGAVPGAPSGSGLPSGFEVLVRYVATSNGLRREAVQRIPVLAANSTSRNLNPVISSATVGPDCHASPTTCAVGGVTIDVTIDAGSFQPYAVGDRSVDETIVVSFFTTAGRFKDQSGQATPAAPATSALLEPKELGGATEALVWVVARDLRGGEAVAGPLTVVFSKP